MKLWAKNLFSMVPALIPPIIAGTAIMLLADIQTIAAFILFACLYTLISAVSFWSFAMNGEERDMLAKPVLHICRKIFHTGGRGA